MSKFDKALGEWVHQGFLSVDQASRIRMYENEKSEQSWVLSSLLFLGMAIIGIGIISLIAANWSEIPDSLKLIADFSLLGVLVFFIVDSSNKTLPVRFEALLFLYLLLCLGSIGLIAQIYHTGGKLYQALLLWSILTLTPTLVSRSFFIPLVWSGTFLFSLSYAATDSPVLGLVFKKNYMAIFLTVTMLSAVLTLVCRSLERDSAAFTKSFRIWTTFLGLLALGVAELSWRSHSDGNEYVFSSYGLAYAFGAIAVGTLAMSIDYSRLQKLFLAGALILLFVQVHLVAFNPAIVSAFSFDLTLGTKILRAFMTILVLALMAFFFASIHSRKLFEKFLTLIGLRFLFLYFQALGGLALTGLGLICSGLLVIGGGLMWSKYKGHIMTWFDRWSR